MAPELVVFDFDGTLAHRPGRWSACLLEVLDQHDPTHGVTVDDVRAQLREGFPWHRPDVAHPELNDPDDWWADLGTVIDRTYRSVGVDVDALGGLRAAVRANYCDPTRFEAYPDSIPALERLRHAGVRTVILSNHVPELDAIVRHLGFDALVDDVISSACIGFEKPHPEAYAAALGPTMPGNAWMIGDNPVADERGARAAGMQAVLVRHATSDLTVADAVTRLLGTDEPPGSGAIGDRR